MFLAPKAKRPALIALAGLIIAHWPADLRAQEAAHNTCHSFAPGVAVPEPEDLRSKNGELTVDLTIHNYKDQYGSTRYCYITSDGKESPNLRLNPGDLLILNLKNDLSDLGDRANLTVHNHQHGDTRKSGNPCTSGLMSATSTNLHFHG